jgi:hypothetical protein
MSTIKVKMKDTKLWAQESPALPPMLYEKDKVYDISANTALSIIRQGFGVQVSDKTQEEDNVEIKEKMDKEPKKQDKMLKPKKQNKSKNKGKK